MAFYLITNFIIIILGLIGSNSHDKCFSFICRSYLVFYLCFFASVRYGIGTDYHHYEYYYEAVKLGSKLVYNSSPLFLLLNKLCLLLKFDFKIFIFICSFITILYFTRSINNEVFIFEMLIFYGLIYIQSFCIIRQMMACTIVIYGMKKEQQWTKEILLFILAALIHSSFWLIVLLYILSKVIKINISICNYIILISFVILYFTNIIQFILVKAASIIGIEMGAGYYILTRHLGPVVLLRYCFMLCYLYIYNKIKCEDYFLNLLIVVIFLAEFAGTRMPILAARLPQTFYVVFFMIFTPDNWNKLRVSMKKKYSLMKGALYSSIFLIYIVLYLQLTTGFKLNYVVPYTWIFGR